MADGAPYTKQQHRSTPSTTTQNKKNPSKFYSSFLFKALIITLFLVIIPLFLPSESPDFATSRFWELLQLILVGLAVSYGIFSRKNDDHSDRENSNNTKNDGAQSYMSRLLQLPSIFDDEADDNNNNSNSSTSSGNSSDSSENKLQTWSSRYRRNEPLLVVAKKSSGKSGIDEIEKPLLLPVRSLKSKISDGNDVGLDDRVDSRVYARSNSMPVDGGFVPGENSRVYSNGSRRISKHSSLKSQSMVGDEFGFVNSIKGSSGRFGGFNDEDVGKNATNLGSEFGYGSELDHNNGVSMMSMSRTNSGLSSRGSSNKVGSSGRFVDFDGEDVSKNGTLGSEFGSYANEHDNHRVSGSLGRSNSSSSPRGSSNKNSSKLISSGRFVDFDGEHVTKNATVRSEFGSYANDYDNNRVSGSLSRSNLSSSPRSSSKKNSSKLGSNGRRGDFGKEDEMKREENCEQSVVLPSPIPWWSRSDRIETKGESPTSSMEGIGPTRLFKPPRSPSISSPNKEPPTKTPPSEPQTKIVEDVGRRKVVLGFPPPPPPPPPPPRPSIPRPPLGLAKSRSSMDQKAIPNSSTTLNDKSEVKEEPGKKSEGGYDHPMSKEFFSGFPKETRDFLEEVFVDTDYDSESDDNGNYKDQPEDRVENEKVEQEEEEVERNEITDDGPDVDKKADEFIAKFREQIRLQRIEEIKRAAQLKKSSIT